MLTLLKQYIEKFPENTKGYIKYIEKMIKEDGNFTDIVKFIDEYQDE